MSTCMGHSFWCPSALAVSGTPREPSEEVVAVGGKDLDDEYTTAIHTYNTTTKSWEVISHMATPRSRCLVAVLPRNELMVVGGNIPDSMTDSVEIATIV